MTDGTLFVVATPIGNLEDLSPRARQILREVELVASEDTRRTGRLLSHFGIQATQIALHEHNEAVASERIIEALGEGRSVALVSDAGTPLISDPGYRLLRAAHDAGKTVCPIPGPSALIAALSVAGLATDRFCFEGFLPAKSSGRKARLTALKNEERTLVFYEAVHRISATIADMHDILGPGRDAFIGRELSKMHEQCVLAPLERLVQQLADSSIPTKGEFVIVVAGAPESAEPSNLDTDTLLRRLAPLLPPRQAAEIVAEASGQRRNAVYQRMLELTRNEAPKEPS
ncbi:MAG: 16S rRNA (cytidine(1402)-2'-O)-methyltransferase [Woeseia sp.]